MSDQRIDDLVRSALTEAQPTENDDAFLARLHRRIAVEESLSPSPQVSPSELRLGWGWTLALGVAAVALVIMALVPLVRIAPTPQEPTQPTGRARVAQLAAEHQGDAMVVDIDETRGSVLFVAAVGQAAAGGEMDQSLISGPGSVSLRRPGANGSTRRGSGWIRTQRRTSAEPRT